MHVDASDVDLLDVARFWPYVNETSGALTCYNFYSNSQIVAFFLVLTIYTCIYIYISSGALTCYNFHSNSHIVAFFLCVDHIYMYIF